MIKLELKITGAPPAEIDGDAVEKVMDEAASEHMRQRGGKRGANLIGLTGVVKEAAEEEVQRQIDDGADDQA